MKKILGVIAVTTAFASCGDGSTGQRQHEMQDNAVERPTTSPQSNTTMYDTSTSMQVRDSSTTVGYDTGTVRKN